MVFVNPGQRNLHIVRLNTEFTWPKFFFREYFLQTLMSKFKKNFFIKIASNI